MRIEGKGLIVLVKSNDTPDLEVIKEALERYRVFMAKWRNMQESATIADSSAPTAH